MDELLDKAKNGDIEAYSEVINFIKSDLEKLAYSKLSDKNYVDDVLQSVYYKAYKNLNSLKDNEKFKSWIFTILRNECININKSLATHKEVFFEDIEEDFEENLIDYSNYDPDSKMNFEEMIKDLSDEEKKLFRMKFEQNFTNTEIAEELGIPYNTVKSKINRALKRMALMLLILIMVSGFTVLATLVIKKIRAHFTTSLDAINTAVENNYIQEIDSDFVYSNGIGVKIDAIILDDKNLDISFMYDILDKEKYGEITDIGISNYIVKAGDEILYNSSNLENNSISFIYNRLENFNILDGVYNNSILFSSNKYFSKIDKVSFEISEIIVKTNDKTDYINGNWNLEHNIIDLLNVRKPINYIMEDNEYAKSAKAILMDTSIQFDIVLDKGICVRNVEDMILYDSNDIDYRIIGANLLHSNNELIINYDLGKYKDNIEVLFLKIPLESYYIIIKFRRES